MQGSRQEALALSLKREAWAIALLVGSVCGPEQYQQAVRLFACSAFPSNSPIFAAAMLYSNQLPQQLLQQQSDHGEVS